MTIKPISYKKPKNLKNARLHARKAWVKSRDERGYNTIYSEAEAFTDGFNIGWKAGRRSKDADE